MHGLVAQHGAQRDAARQVRAVLDPFEKLAGVVFQHIGLQHFLHVEPGLVLGFPDLGGQRATYGAGVFARFGQARNHRRRIGRIAHHEVDDFTGAEDVVVLGKAVFQLGNTEQGAPDLGVIFVGLRQHAGLHIDVQHAGGVLGALGVARHPEQVVGGAA